MALSQLCFPDLHRKGKLMAWSDKFSQASLESVQLLLATYRYDHRARTKRRRAAARLNG
jgi:hypothetical protein